MEPEALRLLSETAMRDVAHLLRSSHLQQLSNILDDDEASENDRFVALELLKNANIAAKDTSCLGAGHGHGNHHGKAGQQRHHGWAG